MAYLKNLTLFKMLRTLSFFDRAYYYKFQSSTRIIKVLGVKHNRVNYSNQENNTTYNKVCCKTKI